MPRAVCFVWLSTKGYRKILLIIQHSYPPGSYANFSQRFVTFRGLHCRMSLYCEPLSSSYRINPRLPEKIIINLIAIIYNFMDIIIK
jgi:hypothetical protein